MWVVVIGFVSGIISGMGIGGGTILIPALVLLLDIGQQQAQGINLLYFLPTAAVALWTHNKNQNVVWDHVKPIAVWGIVGAIIGSLVAISLDGEVLRKIFGGFLLLMGLREIRQK
nr:sulfite exporter TauE/SafE family protein [Chakrabartyella piscis]